MVCNGLINSLNKFNIILLLLRSLGEHKRMKKQINLVLLILCTIIYSCKEGGQSMSQILEPTICDPSAAMDSLIAHLYIDSNMIINGIDESRTEQDYLEYATSFYQSPKMINKNPIWLNSKGPTAKFNKFMEALSEAEYHGLSAKNYIDSTDSTYRNVLPNFKTKKEITDQLAADFEMQTTLNFMRFNADLLFGKYSTDSFFTHKEWSATNDSTLDINKSLEILSESDGGRKLVLALTPKNSFYTLLVDEMHNLKNYAEDTSILDIAISDSLRLGDSSEVIKQIASKILLRFGEDTSLAKPNFDIKLEKLVTRFQVSEHDKPTGVISQRTVNQLNKPVDGKIAQLKKNLERWRWSNKEMGKGDYIFVNIPAFRLFYFQKDTLAMAMNCVVGKTKRKSPTIDAQMKNIVLNPTWTVPPTILKKDILPSIKRSGGYAVARRGLTAYDRRGRKVNPRSINSGNYKAFRYVQKPSYNNSLGTVKFNMPNKELVYIHDTNHRWGFENKVRANSSGCVRVMHPRDMATLILAPQNYTREIIDSVIKTKKTTTVNLDKEIMSHFIYFTTAPDTAGVVIYYPDVYKHDRLLEGYDF